MAKLLFVLAVLCACAAVHAVDVKVTLNVFSGGEDPSWTVSGAAADQLLALMPADANADVTRPIPWYRLGYRGFEVTVMEANSVVRSFAIYNNFHAENALLVSGNATVPVSVVSHVVSEAWRLRQQQSTADPRPLDMMAPVPPTAPCDLPVRGPDNGTTYNPQGEVCGFWTTHCSANNCYNYGNDIVTDTFAQPGRGTGQKWSFNTCEDIRASATRDGLIWVGQTLPTENPTRGHFVSLHIWPNTNFHWIRFDTVPKGYWSHKPGGTPARNVDGSGQKITDPSKADFSPWTQFCGYMTTIPSLVRIG